MTSAEFMSTETEEFGNHDPKFSGLFANDDLPKAGNIRNCQLCTHQKVCVIWSLFKANIQNKAPELDGPKGKPLPIIDSDDLAKVCRMYQEK